MERTRIKICGITRVEDALAAARAGADAIGLLFHPPAQRNLSVQRAEQIVGALPPFVTPVGLFVDAPAEQVREVGRRLRLRHVQLHGDEPPERVAELAEWCVVKAVRVERDRFGEDLAAWREAIKRLKLRNLSGLVLETAGTGKAGAPAGGTGAANDWETVLRHLRRGDFIGLPPIIAAGGLRPETVGAVVRDLRPWAVDVSSGVEESPGQKSPQKIAAFVAAVRQADRDSRPKE